MRQLLAQETAETCRSHSSHALETAEKRRSLWIAWRRVLGVGQQHYLSPPTVVFQRTTEISGRLCSALLCPPHLRDRDDASKVPYRAELRNSAKKTAGRVVHGTERELRDEVRLHPH